VSKTDSTDSWPR